MGRLITLISNLWQAYRVWTIASAAVALLLFGSYHLGHHIGVKDQQLAEANAKAAGILKGVQSRDKTDKAVSDLSDPDLDHELSKWMRD